MGERRRRKHEGVKEGGGGAADAGQGSWAALGVCVER